jgi:hypothetical protein
LSSSFKSIFVPTSKTGIPPQWCLISGAHLKLVF